MNLNSILSCFEYERCLAGSHTVFIKYFKYISSQFVQIKYMNQSLVLSQKLSWVADYVQRTWLCHYGLYVPPVFLCFLVQSGHRCRSSSSKCLQWITIKCWGENSHRILLNPQHIIRHSDLSTWCASEPKAQSNSTFIFTSHSVVTYQEVTGSFPYTVTLLFHDV